MSCTTPQLLDLYEEDIGDVVAGEYLTEASLRRGHALDVAMEAASWCLLTGQPWPVYLELTREQRNAFIEVLNRRPKS